MTMDWRRIHSKLKSAINLPSDPVGIRMLRDAGDLMSYPEAKILNKTAVCHLVALARYYREEGVVASPSEGMKCVWGAACLGLMRSPDRLKDGSLYTMFASDRRASRELHKSIGMIGDERREYGALLLAPLDLCRDDPDAIIIYLTPAQALRLVIAHVYRTGKAINTNITGQASVCASIARVLQGSPFEVDIPCMGDRLYGILQEQEMVVVINAREIERLIEGIDATSRSAPHPYRPFLKWPVIFPPEMEPRGPEL